MKRLVALAALLLLPLWGCTQPAEAPANITTTNANAARTTASPAAATVSEATITDQEKQVWDAIKRKDNTTLSSMLTDDFIFVSSDGLQNKTEAINGIKDFNPTDYTFSEWKVIAIDKDAAVVTYKLVVKGTSMGKPLPDTPARCSSVWVNRNGKWVAIFHQDTDVQTAPATPPANANANANSGTKPANANASPAASPAAEPTDPVAKEKQLWEELKHKNFDAFASDLADNAVEVEPDGVYDKAGSINGVKGFDFSTSTLSDFKEVKIDADATIVTYVVKSGKMTERHSTVWTKHGSNWLALWHQGTPQGAMPSPAK